MSIILLERVEETSLNKFYSTVKANVHKQEPKSKSLPFLWHLFKELELISPLTCQRNL